MKLLLADDQILFIESLRKVINLSTDDIEIVGVATNGLEAVRMARESEPDVILMDIRMPEMDGVQAAVECMRNDPAVKIIMLTTFDDDDYVHTALKAGAKGYLLKDIPLDDLVNAIRTVGGSSVMISPSVAEHLLEERAASREASRSLDDTTVLKAIGRHAIDPLSRREEEIALLIARQYSNHQIAHVLDIAEQTVRNHVSTIYSKLDVHSRHDIFELLRRRYNSTAG